MKLHLRLIRFIGLIVPQRLRADWRQEWEAELHYRETQLAEWDKLDWQTKLELFRASCGALWDALLLQPRRLEDEMFQDLRFGARMLLKHKGFTLVAVLSLALGIGANTAIFSVVNAVLLRALPFAEAEQLMMVWETQPDVRGPVGTYPDFLDWRAQAQSFQGLAAFSNKRYGKAELSGYSETMAAQGMLISQNLFPLLGLKPLLGRNFLPEEEQSINNRVVMLSQSLWRRGFASDAGIIGKSIQLDGADFTVVGVMGEQYPLETDFWLPLSHLSQTDLTSRKHHSVQAIGRLKPGVTVEQARQEMATINERLRQLYPATNKNIGVELTPMRHHLVGNLRPMVLLIFAAVALILLIACANVSNLLLAQSSWRQRELAIRAAIGAGRGRLVRQLLVESLLLATLGGIAGLALAACGLPVLKSGLLEIVTGKIPGLEIIGIDWRTLAFTAGVSLLTGVLFGALPALQISRTDLHQPLKDGGRSSAGIGRRNFSRALIMAEVALAVIVLIGAGLLARSFQKLLRVEPGFQTGQLLSLKIELSRSRYQKPEQVKNFYQQLMSRIQAIPGVEQVGIIDRLPLAPSLRVSRFVAEGQQPQRGQEPIAQTRMADHRFFQTMGIAQRSGRLFDETDAVNDNEVIINETLAQGFFKNQEAVGKRLFMHFGAGDPLPVQIIGVVADIKDLGLDATVEPTIYWPGVGGEAVLFARTTVDPLSLAAAVRQTALSVDPALPLPPARSVEEMLDASRARRRFALILLCIAALSALLLAAIGIYGVVTSSVAQRVSEIGIRLALGAQTRDILKLVIGHGIAPALLGVLVGLAGAVALTRELTSLTAELLFEVRVTDPLTFAVIVLLLLTVAALACYLPARRATKVDPIIALRHE
ncbi:MAG: ABC transporter permease [Blastocatellia bacterium]|nr:ABC transporter permease [Blastocatellia bacterium]